MLKYINKSQTQKLPATRSSVITHFWISARTTSRYYVYLYPLNKICLVLVDQWVILDCLSLGLFHICMDTKINKKLNWPCAVTRRSRKPPFSLNGWTSRIAVHLYSHFFESYGKEGNTKYKVDSASDCPMLAGQGCLKLPAKAKDELQSSPSWAETHRGMPWFSAMLAAWVRSLLGIF